MKGFLVDTLLPFVAVAVTTAILTLAVFDPPPRTPAEPLVPSAEMPRAPSPPPRSPAPAATSSAPPQVSGNLELGASAQPRGSSERDRVAKQDAMEAMNEIFARALRNFSLDRPSPSESPQPSETVDPNLPASLKQLGEAIRAARNARDQQDLLEAEQMLRGARQQMEESCGTPGSPLCQSAKSIKDLGY